MICKTLEELQNALREKVKDDTESIRSVTEATGVSKSMLNYFKNGERNLAFENLDKLAKHYGVKYTIKNH